MSQVELAARANSRLFFVYFVVLIAAAILSWLVWRAGNRLQDAVRADADARIAEAQAVASTANERAKRLEIEASGQRERAAMAEQELLKLRERVRQRTLTNEQRIRMSDELKAATDKCRIELVAPDTDPEAQTFMLVLSFVFEGAGWRIGRLHRPLQNVPAGLVLFHAPGDLPPGLEEAEHALAGAGFPPALETDPNVVKGTARLVVGAKTTEQPPR